MALQFSSSIKTLYTNSGLNGLAAFGPSSITISIHSGERPSMSSLVADWATKHRQGIAGASVTLLATYTNAGWTVTGPSITMTKFPAAVTPFKNGTAAWAIIWANGSTLSTNSIPMYFAVVPVTTTAGDGVIRFTSLDFTTSAPVIMIDAGLTIL